MGPLCLFCASVDHSDHYGTIFCVDDFGMEDEGPRPAQYRPQQDLIPITTLFEGDVVGLDEEPTSMGSFHDKTLWMGFSSLEGIIRAQPFNGNRLFSLLLQFLDYL